MIKKITQKEFTNEIIGWNGENVSCCSFSINNLNINSLDDIETLFSKYDLYEAVKTWRVKKDLKVEIKSNYLLLNNSRLDIRGKYFKFNDDILGVMDNYSLIIYYKNK